MTGIGLTAQCGLEAAEIAQVRALADACERTDGVCLKLNWGLMKIRDGGLPGDFCCFDGARLAGYLQMDDFEITGAVHAAYRRQGIFRRLFEAARDEARRQEADEALLVSYRTSAAGTAAAKRLDVTYKTSEYCMEAHAAMQPLPCGRVQLAEVTPESVDDLSRMLALSFENTRWSQPERLLQELAKPDTRYFLARVEDRPIGQIGVVALDTSLYIRALGILPECRRQGFGRDLLAATVEKMQAEGHRHFVLDVATDNESALSIYHACGFRSTNIYDYYKVPLMALPGAS